MTSGPSLPGDEPGRRVSSRIVDGIGFLRLERPDRRNAIDAEMVRQAAAAIEGLTAEGVLVAVIEAAGPVFSAGGDRSEAGTTARSSSRLVEAIGSAPIFWAARVQGPAIGGGVALAAVCPLTVLTPSSWFQLPEIGQGFLPTAVLAYLEPIVGPRRALHICLSSARIDPSEVVALGMAEAVIGASEIDGFLLDRLRPLAASPAAARAASRSWSARFATPAFRSRREELMALLP